jgi:hypothetical protein
MQKDNSSNEDAVEVRCIQVPGGLLTVMIRTLTNEDLQRLLQIPRAAPKRVLAE